MTVYTTTVRTKISHPWTADGYCVEFHYLVVAESLDNAKELWNESVTKLTDGFEISFREMNGKNPKTDTYRTDINGGNL